MEFLDDDKENYYNLLWKRNIPKKNHVKYNKKVKLIIEKDFKEMDLSVNVLRFFLLVPIPKCLHQILDNNLLNLNWIFSLFNI